MSLNTTNLGRQAQTGTLYADTVRTGAMVVSALTVTGNIEAGSENVAGALTANSLGITGNIATATLNTSGDMLVGNNLGVTGQMSSSTLNTGTATVVNTITAKSFSQPKSVAGSAGTPLVTPTTLTYSSALTKYIWYYTVTNNTQFNQVFTLTGFPDGFFATNSAIYDATFVSTGTWTGGSVPITTADLYASETDNILSVNVLTPIAQPPQFTGTCYIKVVISFSVD